MASKTLKMRQLEEEIKQKIVRSHRAGLCDKEGQEIVRSVRGTGHTNRMVNPLGPERYNVWPRDENGKLIGDD